MKKVLVLVLSSDFTVYTKMMETSQLTWDSGVVENVETIFYCSQRDNPDWKDTDKVKYFDVPNGLYDIGHKNIAMFEWALANKDFDYICRVNASCYVNKKLLSEYAQTLPDENVFCGAEVVDVGKQTWYWGGCSFIFSKDVIQKIVSIKEHYNHKVMEDVAISYLINELQIPVIPAKSCTIDNMGEKWRCMVYNGVEDSFEFTDWKDLSKLENQFMFRVKQDGRRYLEEFIMTEMFKVLK